MRKPSARSGLRASSPQPSGRECYDRFFWLVMAGTVSCLGVGGALAAAGSLLAGAGAVMAGAALVISWGLPTGPRKARRGRSSLVRPPVEPEDLYLDLDVVEVQAVYVLGHELFTHLTGGVGRRRDLATGAERPIETSEVSLTWRCSGRRAALELARQLNKWQADRVPLRLVAARGRCAALIEDDDNWVSLPELKLAV